MNQQLNAEQKKDDKIIINNEQNIEPENINIEDENINQNSNNKNENKDSINNQDEKDISVNINEEEEKQKLNKIKDLHHSLSCIENDNKEINILEHNNSQKEMDNIYEKNIFNNDYIYKKNNLFKPYFYPRPYNLYKNEAIKINKTLMKYKELAKKEEKLNIAERGRQITIAKNQLIQSRPDQIVKKMNKLSENYFICLQRKNNPYSVMWEKFILKTKYSSELKIKKFYNCLPQYKAPIIKSTCYDSSYIKNYKFLSKNINKNIEFPTIYKYFNNNNHKD